MAYFCPYCGNYTGTKFERQLRHIRYHHSHESNFAIACGDCGQTFKKFESFKSHIRRKHKDQEVAIQHQQHEDQHDEIQEEATDDGNMEPEEDDDIDNVEELTRFLALFILKTKETNGLSQQAMNAITKNAVDLVEVSLDSLKSDILRCFRNNGISITTINGLEEVLQKQSPFLIANERLSTEYFQKKYFKEQFNYIVPEEIVLSHRVERKLVKGRYQTKVIKESFQYVSILQTLRALLLNPEVLDQVRHPHYSTDGVLRDFCDGTDFKNHVLFSNDPSSLVLHCYFDEFQTANPLGSKTKNHKLGAFYFSLGNINPCHRSSVNMIFLFALCKVPIIKKFKPNKIMEAFIQDLKELENEGLTVNVEDNIQTFKGSIGPFSADNLGSHTIGGFLESFSCLRICRVCMATKADIQCKFHEHDFQLRTKDGHNNQCELVKDDPLLSTVYGVKQMSSLNDLRYFHVIGGMDLDIMHDQLEGVLPTEVKLLLEKYIYADRYFTVEEFNRRIQSFNYGMAEDKNKPSEVKSASGDIRLSQTAAQMWCLSRMLPLLIGDFVAEDDPNWENYLRLLKIEEIIFAQQTTVQLAAYLSVLVAEYLENYTNLYEKPVIPKQHYMVHYPNQIVRRGPLVRNWSMRFEAKHHYFKKLVSTINNFKNIESSLARRHQALQAYLMQTNRSLFKLSLELGPGKKISMNEMPVPLAIEEVNEESDINRVSWVTVYGTTYSKSSILVVTLIRGNVTFGEIHYIFVVDSKTVVFYYEELRVVQYVNHLNAYQVQHSNTFAYIKQQDIVDSHPVGTHEGFNANSQKLFVVLKYRVDCMLE